MPALAWYFGAVVLLTFAFGWFCCEMRERERRALDVDRAIDGLRVLGGHVDPPPPLRLVAPSPYDWARDA